MLPTEHAGKAFVTKETGKCSSTDAVEKQRGFSVTQRHLEHHRQSALTPNSQNEREFVTYDHTIMKEEL